MPYRHPNCYIIAGPNGAGKTTFATRFLPVYADCRNFINPDLLASEPPELVFKDEAGNTTITNGALYERLRTEYAP